MTTPTGQTLTGGPVPSASTSPVASAPTASPTATVPISPTAPSAVSPRPSTTLTPPASVVPTATAPSSDAPTATPSVVPADLTSRILHERLEAAGFDCEQPMGGFSCSRGEPGGPTALISVYATGDRLDGMVSGVSGPDDRPISDDAVAVFKEVMPMLLSASDATVAEAWIAANIDTDGAETTIGGHTFLVGAAIPTGRGLQITFGAR